MKIFEVGPRDGLQNEAASVPVAAKVSLIESLAVAGLRHIECGSFVSPKWVPQWRTPASFSRSFIAFQASLIQRSFQISTASPPPSVLMFPKSPCSPQHPKASHTTTSTAPLPKVSTGSALSHTKLLAQNIRVRGYVSCVLGCPYEGAVPLTAVGKVAAALASMGCYEISLGDTIGIGTPHTAQAMVKAVAQAVPAKHLAVHFHDTWGQALANILATLDTGIATIDSSVAGLGGCPYAKGASGNVATEDVVYMLDGLGVETGIDLEKLGAAGHQIIKMLGRNSSSKAAATLPHFRRISLEQDFRQFR